MLFNFSDFKHHVLSSHFSLTYFLLFSVLHMLPTVQAQDPKAYTAEDIYEFAKRQQPIPDGVDINTVISKWQGGIYLIKATALHLAVVDNALDAAAFILEQGANVNYASYLEYSDAGTPLHYAMSPEMAQLLLENGAELNSQAIFNKTTPIHEALVRQKKDVVNFLLKEGADLNTGAVKEGDLLYFISQGAIWFIFDSIVPVFPLVMWSPADIFVFSVPFMGLSQFISYLAETGNTHFLVPAVELGGIASFVVGTIAAQEWKFEILPQLKSLGYKLNLAPKKTKNTPLNAAIAIKDKEIIEMLVEEGADVNGQGTLLKQPLVETIINYRNDEDAGIEVLRLLIEEGADVNKAYNLPFFNYEYRYRDDKYTEYVSFDSALELALKLKCMKIAAFLLNNGADGSYQKEEESISFDGELFDGMVNSDECHQNLESMHKLQKNKRLDKTKAYQVPKRVTMPRVPPMIKAPNSITMSPLR